MRSTSGPRPTPAGRFRRRRRATARPGHFFCWTRPMSSGVYDRAAAAFLVHDPRAQEAFWFWRRGGVAQVEHYFASTLASYYDRKPPRCSS